MFRVGTFNLHGGRSQNGILNLEKSGESMVRSGAELFALQELDRGLPRSNDVDQARVLQEEIGLPLHFRPTIRRSGGGYGIALAAEGLSEISFEDLPRAGSEEARGVIVARWRGISVAATHLAWQREVARIQLRALLEIVQRLPPPAVIMGDLNLLRWSLRPLRAAGFDPGPRRGTFKSRPFKSQIDYVLTGPGLQRGRTFTVPSEASDHLPLIAAVEPCRA